MERKKLSNENHEGLPVEELSQGFLNIRQIANYLGIKTSTLYSMAEEKRVPHYRIGRQIRFKRSEIDEWMAEQREAVVDVKVEAKKVFRPIEKKADLDINRIVKKAVDGAKRRGYNSAYGKPDQIKGLRKEVGDGSL